jgi:hypothetical protein
MIFPPLSLKNRMKTDRRMNRETPKVKNPGPGKLKLPSPSRQDSIQTKRDRSNHTKRGILSRFSIPKYNLSGFEATAL